MWVALILAMLAAGAAAGNSSCACSAGFPPLPVSGFKSISGYAGCIINYVQFEDATGAVVFTSGTLSGGEPFSVSCSGNNTITGFSYLCNAGSGPNGAFPTPTFASLSTIGGVTCSNGSAPVYTGSLNSNVCELANDYTQLGFLDCGADGSVSQSCFSEGGGCVQGAFSHAPCVGTETCQINPTPPPSPGIISCTGQFTTVDLTPYFNWDCEANSDPAYQPPQGPNTFAGIPFSMPVAGAKLCSWFGGGYPGNLTLSFNCPNAIGVHAIMNTDGGTTQPGTNLLYLTSSSGNTVHFDLLGNSVIRDMWLVFTSNIDNPPTINIWTGTHSANGGGTSVMDMQSFNITDGLSTFSLIDNDGINGYVGMANNLYGLTIESSQ